MRKFIRAVVTARLQKFLIICLSFIPFLTVSNSAHAQCVNVGGIVSCAIDDPDGVASAVDITDLTINNGVTVDDSGGDLGGIGIIDINGNVTGTILNNGIINDAIGNNDPGIDVSGTLNALINNGTITTNNDFAVNAFTLTSLINNGTITTNNNFAVNADQPPLSGPVLKLI